MVAGRVSLAVALFGPAAVAAAATLSAQAVWETPSDIRTWVASAGAAACLLLAAGIAAGVERAVVWALVAVCGIGRQARAWGTPASAWRRWTRRRSYSPGTQATPPSSCANRR